MVSRQASADVPDEASDNEEDGGGRDSVTEPHDRRPALECGKVSGERINGLMAAFRPRIACALDHASEGGTHIGPRRANGDAFILLVRASNVADRAALDRIRLRREVIEQHAQAVDVALRRRRSAGENLRRQAQRRTRQIGRRAVIQLLAGAEVHQHHSAIFSAHDVVGLDVPVQQTGGVHGGNGTANLHADAGDLS